MVKKNYEEIVEELVEELVELEPEVEPEPVVEEVTPEPVRGVVTDCLKLNVREAPNPDADIICTIVALTEVEIDVDQSTGDFYKIYTSTGIEGFCMSKFIAVC